MLRAREAGQSNVIDVLHATHYEPASPSMLQAARLLRARDKTRAAARSDFDDRVEVNRLMLSTITKLVGQKSSYSYSKNAQEPHAD